MSIRFSRRHILTKAILGLILIGSLCRSAAAGRQPIEDPSQAMLAFYKALYRTENGAGPVWTRIIHYGDSHVAADILTGALREKFQLDFERRGRGVIYDALGRNGARATDLLAWDWRSMTSSLGRQKPNLIVIAYGSNEVGDADLDLSDYAASFRELLARFRRASPEASILVISPPDRAVRVGARWRTIAGLSRLVEVQRQAALEQGAAFWNQFRAMGGAGSIDRWVTAELARPDRVHLTRSGYRIVAEMLYEELMRGYLLALIGKRGDRERAGAAAAVSPGL
ncbi:MAG TPA: SGNH/GDSL hydrolase family protein [Blastocatellia bacterium]|nr:SGNH/GDSL hydrolase family protein [Blastocatellia bacterium]